MNRTLVTAVPGLTEDQISRIRQTAGRFGFEARFFETAAESVDALQDAEVIFGGEPLLSQNAPKLRWLCSCSAGINQFTAPDAFANPDAMLSNSSGAYGVTIAEHTVMAALNLLRRETEYADFVRSRQWRRGLPVRSIRDSRILMLGTGDIGQETARRLRGFSPAGITGVNRGGKNPEGMFDRVFTTGELNRLLPETDLLIISLPGTKETFHLIGREQLALLPDHAAIVNVGRGSVIDETALEETLRAGRLHAALDVFETEPLPEDSTLWTCPRLLITPHVAGDFTLPYTLEKAVELFLEDFERYCGGLPPKRLVSREAGY